MRQAYNYTRHVIQCGPAARHSLLMARRKKFPNKIAVWRKLRGLQQEDIAEAIDRSQETVARYESGEINPPTSILRIIARLLKCDSTEDLFRSPGIQDEIADAIRSLKDPVAQRHALSMIKGLNQGSGSDK
jgi:transcriptional regulator with XRE-family HTH domain